MGSNTFGLRYDATPPALSKVGVTSKDADAVLRWQSSSPADTITVRRSARGNKGQSMLFRGAGSSFDDKKIQRGLEYVYTVQSTDEAGNVSKPVTAVALPKILINGGRRGYLVGIAPGVCVQLLAAKPVQCALAE